MNDFKYLILICTMHSCNTLFAMGALNSKQEAIAKEEPSKTFPSNALIAQNSTPNAMEKMAINNKLIDLLIEQAKYDTTLGGQIQNNTLSYANKVANEASELLRHQDRSREFYILTYLLYSTLDDLKEKNIIDDAQYEELDQRFTNMYSTRNVWWTPQVNPPKTLKDLQKIINTNQNVSQAELDNLIGYYFECDRGDTITEKYKETILKTADTFGTYFGNQFADYYFEQREQYLGNKPKPTIFGEIKAIKPFDKNLTLEEANKLNAYELFGLPENYKDTIWLYREEIKNRYKRLSLMFHPDIAKKKNLDIALATEVFRKINELYESSILKD